VAFLFTKDQTVSQLNLENFGYLRRIKKNFAYPLRKGLKIVDHVNFCNYALVHVVYRDLAKLPSDFFWSRSPSIFLSQSDRSSLGYVVLTLERSEDLLDWRAKVGLKHLKLVICLLSLKMNLINLRTVWNRACTFLCTRYALCALW